MILELICDISDLNLSKIQLNYNSLRYILHRPLPVRHERHQLCCEENSSGNVHAQNRLRLLINTQPCAQAPEKQQMTCDDVIVRLCNLTMCTALYGSTSLQQSSKGSCSLLVSGLNLRGIASGIPWILRTTVEPMQHPHQCWRWCRPW